MTEKIVLVGVIRRKQDLVRVLKEHWYRIPVRRAPVRQFDYLAFYEPAVFGREGKRIRYYARVRHATLARRNEILPDEPWHSRTHDWYLKFDLGRIQKLSRPVRNSGAPRRVSFGFTTLACLCASKDILELYRVAPTEQIMEEALKKAGIHAVQQFRIAEGRKRFRLDFAVMCQRGSVAIECDNKKAHSGSAACARDAAKDAFLKGRGWAVVRLQEREIIFRTAECVARVKEAIHECGRIRN